MIQWQRAAFGELALEELYQCLALRQQVFGVEQNEVYLDLDGVDQKSRHLLGWVERDGARVLAAYARILPPGVRYEQPSIGRVVTALEFRGRGYGRQLMAEAVRWTRELYPHLGICIHAQQYLERFYGEFGFRTVSAPHMHEGRMHVEMILEGAPQA